MLPWSDFSYGQVSGLLGDLISGTSCSRTTSSAADGRPVDEIKEIRDRGNLGGQSIGDRAFESLYDEGQKKYHLAKAAPHET